MATLAQPTSVPAGDPDRKAYISQETITNPQTNGTDARSAWVNAKNLEHLNVTVKGNLNQNADWYFEGAYDAAGTDAFRLGDGAKLTIASGAGQGVMSLTAFPGWISVFCVPAANATGTVDLHLIAHARLGEK